MKYKANILFYDEIDNSLRILYTDGSVEVLNCLDNEAYPAEWILSTYSTNNHKLSFKQLSEDHILVGEI